MKCGWEGEEMVASYEIKFIRCPKCDGQAEKQFTPGSTFHLKGSGWAHDGYTTKGSLEELNRKANTEAKGG